MAEEAFDDFSRRYQVYVKWIVRRVFVSILDRERLKRLTRDVLRRMAVTFSDRDLDDGNNRTICSWLDETIYSELRGDLSEKDYFVLMARQKLSPMAEAGACRAHDEIYRLHKRDLSRSIKRFPGRPLSNEEVEDLIQKVLWIAYQKAHQFNADARGISDEQAVHSLAHAWLTMIAYHTFIDEGRGQKGEITILNVGDVARGSDEIDPEDLLENDRCRREGTERLTKEAERQHYPPPETPEVEFGPEAGELIDMVAARVLSERDLDVFLTERAYYASVEEKTHARREVEIRRSVSSNLRSKLLLRCFKKIIKYATRIAQKLLPSIELEIFMAITKLDSESGSKENEWRELENTYHSTRAELREISEQGCKRIKDCLMAH